MSHHGVVVRGFLLGLISQISLLVPANTFFLLEKWMLFIYNAKTGVYIEFKLDTRRRKKNVY